MSIYGMEITAGILVIAFSYIVNDCLTEVYGLKKTRQAILLTFLMHVFAVGMLQIAAWLPPAEYWTEGQKHFEFIFGLAPRITFASILAFIVGSNVNAVIMERMKKQDGIQNKFKWRAFVSTVYGELADSATFFPVAFTGILSSAEIMSLVFIQAMGKIGIETLILPVTDTITTYLKKKEGLINSHDTQ